MKACVFNAPGDLSVVEMPKPEPGQGELLLRVGAAGLCHSDVRVYKGEKYAKPGVVPGHEMSGIIESVGNGVNDLAAGDRVALCPIIACGHCSFCRVGKRNRCVKRITLGYDENGALAEYVLVPEPIVRLGHVFKLPDSVSLSLASLLEPASCVFNSMELMGIGAGTTMLLIGAGPMGLMHLVIARALGANVIASEPDEERRGWARKLGAVETFDPLSQDSAAFVKDMTNGEGADAVAVTTGVVKAAEPAFQAVRKQGVINLFGGFPPNQVLPLDPNVIHYNEIVLTGSQNATVAQYERCLKLLPRLDDLRQVVSNTYTVDDAPKAYESRLNLSGLKTEVVYPGVN
ncbi:MAG TPA: alcohol dehydrogenase catalytic domain-containing protein [Dehalococcoidia bacterium]|nr:alcohol dehydrogenase catalytic domain-containing protein [Dehalococcoidia bacterium]